jgi:glyoxylase-like metal-dependent hydrolase (beta-lactamase superfamily II)
MEEAYITKISNRVRSIEVAKADDLSNEVYILECEGGLILIDVGFTPLCINNIGAELVEMGRSWEDIKLILITHAHEDHIGNILTVIELIGSPEVMLGIGDVDSLKEQTSVKADVGLEHGDLISACGGIEVVAVPGHSDGNLSFYLREEKMMIVGDTLFGDDLGNLYPPPEKYSNDADLAEREIRNLLAYDFDKLLLSHGKNILINAKDKVVDLVNTSQ